MILPLHRQRHQRLLARLVSIGVLILCLGIDHKRLDVKRALIHVTFMGTPSSFSGNTRKTNLVESTPSKQVDPTYRPFPRWNSEIGISLPHLLQFVNGVLHMKESVIYNDKSLQQQFESQLSSGTYFSETLYVVDKHGLHVSRSMLTRTSRGQVSYRVRPTNKIMALAIEMLTTNNDTTTDMDRWERLRQVILKEEGFPFVAWFGDFKGCCLENWRGSLSIPLFTVAAHVSCNMTFPTPTYKTISESYPKPYHWDKVMDEWRQQYAEKISQVVWRGGLTGNIAAYTNPRWRLVTSANRDDQARKIFNVRFTNIPDRHNKMRKNLTEHLIREDLWASDRITPMSAFQQYVAVLDTDGNSWSSRFGSLLCYSSVVLKVEAMYVDYFHFKRKENPLVPWTHFVPVRYDLSDLHERAAWVLDPANAEAVQEIVRAANLWCRNQMNYEALARDYLDIWQEYVKLLDTADPDWYERTWKYAKEQMFQRDSDYTMMMLSS